MRVQSSLGVVAIFAGIVVGATNAAPAGEFGRLAALAAKQDLCDDVAAARADGRISRVERQIILMDAKKVLKPDEYATFKQALYRISPPLPAVAKNTAEVQRPAPVVQAKSPQIVPPSLQTIPDREFGPTTSGIARRNAVESGHAPTIF